MIWFMITIVWYLDRTTMNTMYSLQRKRESHPCVWRSGHGLYYISQWSHHRKDRQHVPQICKWITVSYISTSLIELCFICMFTDSSIIIITTTAVLKYLSLIFFVEDFEVTGLLKDEENVLRVWIMSAVTYASQKSRTHTEYRVPPDCPPPVQKGECHVNFIRKVQTL